MLEKISTTELYEFLIKIVFPAFIGVGFKIAIEMKKTKTKVSILNVLLSLMIGVGGAYISSDWVVSVFDEKYISVVIALIAITSDKIGEFIIYKFNFDTFLTAALDAILDYFINMRNKDK